MIFVLVWLNLKKPRSIAQLASVLIQCEWNIMGTGITPEDNMPRQRKITDFPGSNSVASPAVNQEADIDQSQVSNEINPSSPTSKAPSSNSSKDPPRRTGLKRKKVIKEQRRRARRRVNQPRKCKVTRHDDDSTPQRTTVTPMPSPNGSPNPFDPDNVVCDNPTPLHNRSLTDMLASAAAAYPVNSTSNNQSKDDIASARVRRLESQLEAAALALENETTEKTRYKCALELLQKEIDGNKQVQKISKVRLKDSPMKMTIYAENSLAIMVCDVSLLTVIRAVSTSRMIMHEMNLQ